jgi:hypothetical protein
MAESKTMSKEEIITSCKNATATTARNSMGCNESWYDPFFSMKEVFSEEELNSMSESELNHLYKLADKISEALY